MFPFVLHCFPHPLLHLLARMRVHPCPCVSLCDINEGQPCSEQSSFIVFIVFAKRWFEYSTSICFSFPFRLTGDVPERYELLF